MIEVKKWSKGFAKLEGTQILDEESLELSKNKQSKKVDIEDYDTQELQEETYYNHKFYQEHENFLRDRELQIAYQYIISPL